jgi:peptidoglycan-associated lipoprotein
MKRDMMKNLLTIGLLTIALAACGQKASTSSGSSMGGVSSESQASEAGYLSDNVLDRVFFDTDQSSLSSDARNILRAQASWLKSNSSLSVVIEGHADERGTRDYNLALGARRATAVRDALISYGVSGSQIATISYGKERPVSLCSEDRCWSKNRRAVTTIR